jgi:hypothetical protein
MQWGEISLYFYVPMVVPWKDLWTGEIKKIPRHKEERDGSLKLKTTGRKEWKKEKEEMCSPSVGTALVRPSLRRATRMGISPTTYFY